MTPPQRPYLPETLRKKRTKKIMLRVISCCTLFIICILIIVFWGDRIFRMPDEKYEVLQKSLYIVFCLLPFVITGVPLKLLDTSWDGTISQINIVEGVGTYFRSLGKPGLYIKHDLILTILKDNGKEIQYVAMSLGKKYNCTHNPIPNNGNIEYFEEKYHIGDRVHKYYGFKYLYVSNSHCDAQKQCVVCGTVNHSDDIKCGLCHSELIQ